MTDPSVSPAPVSWWFRVKALFAHSKTILAARLYGVAGTLVAVHDIALPYVASTDVTPLTSRVPQWAWPLVVIGTGVLFEYLRHITTQSLSDNKADSVVADAKAEAPP